MVSMRKGSLEYWPHRRAKRQLPRVRTWPTVAEPIIPGFVAFKAGMTHITMMDDSEGPAKGTEVAKAVTVLEMPKVYVYGIRAYKKNYLYTEPFTEVYDVNLAKRVGIKSIKKNDINEMKSKAAEFEKVSALLFLDPAEIGFANKRIMRFEVPMGGKDSAEKLAALEQRLGKELRITDVVNIGDYVDVTAITKGKGWAGVIKRFSVARQYRKATNKVRHVGVLGAWHPAKVLYTVPHAGHMGYNYRTEINKRILKIGTAADVASINVSGGFPNFGMVKNDFIVVDGSIPGPAKRLIRIRKALRNKAKVKTPNITYISTVSKQGA